MSASATSSLNSTVPQLEKQEKPEQTSTSTLRTVNEQSSGPVSPLRTQRSIGDLQSNNRTREARRQVSPSSMDGRSAAMQEPDRGFPGSRTASSQYGGPDRSSVRRPSQPTMSPPPSQNARRGSETIEEKVRRGVPMPENALGFRAVSGERKPSANRAQGTPPQAQEVRPTAQRPTELISPQTIRANDISRALMPDHEAPERSLNRLVIEDSGEDLAPPIRNGEDFRSAISPPPPAKSPARRPTGTRIASTSSARALHEKFVGIVSPTASGSNSPIPEMPQLPSKSEARSADSPRLDRPDVPWRSPLPTKPDTDYFTAMSGELNGTQPVEVLEAERDQDQDSSEKSMLPLPSSRKSSVSRAFEDVEVDDDTAFIDETIRDFKWTSKAGTEVFARGIQAELFALETANVLAIAENDDRVDEVMRKLDESIAQCDDMANLLTIYEFELATVAEHIQHIEGQSHGLQVQTANQLALVDEITNVLTKITISETDLEVLKGRHGNLESAEGINNLERSLVNLHRALKSTRDDQSTGQGMSAFDTKTREYAEESVAFLSRLGKYLQIKFQAALLSKERKSTSGLEPARVLDGHEDGYMSLAPYASFMLYAREIDPDQHADYMRSYASAAKASWHDAILNFASQWRATVRRATQEETEMIFSAARDQQSIGAARNATLKRSNTLAKQIRSVASSKPDKDANEGKLPASEVFRIILDNLALLLTTEHNFIVTFFHLSSSSSVEFPDYVESYGKSRLTIASLDEHRPMEHNRTLSKERSIVMESIFGWLSSDLTKLIDELTKSDPIQVIGIVKSIEVVHAEWANTDQEFLLKLLVKLKEKLMTLSARFIDAQLRAIKDLKVSARKRRGIIPVFEIFPDFVERIEIQLQSTDSGDVDPAQLEIRRSINDSYEQLSKAMFESVRTLASSTTITSQDPEDKEALNYHILMVQNMHQYLEALQSRDNAILQGFKNRAQGHYNEHLTAYTRQIVLRPIGRLHEFTAAVEKQIKMQEDPTTKSAFSQTSLKRLLSDFDERDIRKGISAMWKRVDKHFSDEDGSSTVLLPIVWKATQDEYRSLMDRVMAILQRHYPQVHVDWSAQTIATAFAKREV